MRRPLLVALAVAAPLAGVASAQPTRSCLTASGRPAAQGAFVMSAPVTIALTRDGLDELEKVGATLSFVHIVRKINPQVPPPPPPPAPEQVQAIAGDAPVIFSFGSEADYDVTLWGATKYGWPERAEVGQRLANCAPHQITIKEVRKADFVGVRGNVWVAYRPGTSGEAGTSIYVGRLGFAATVIGNGSTSEPNRVFEAGDVRWRTSRGYYGGGVRYYRNDEPDRSHWRPTIVAGEEIPLFKGLPLWFIVDLRLDDEHVRPWKALSLSFGERVDLTRGRAP